jgi:hypothetical protein
MIYKNITKLKVLCNGKMSKNKWNGLNSNYKKVADYHVKINHHTPFWDFTIKNNNHHHFPRPFNQEFYNSIQAFQGERLINAPRHMEDIHIKRNTFYMPSIVGPYTEGSIAP